LFGQKVDHHLVELQNLLNRTAAIRIVGAVFRNPKLSSLGNNLYAALPNRQAADAGVKNTDGLFFYSSLHHSCRRRQSLCHPLPAGLKGRPGQLPCSSNIHPASCLFRGLQVKTVCCGRLAVYNKMIKQQASTGGTT
jgi:hypothetical protein